MTDKRIVFTSSDGSVGVIIPAPGEIARRTEAVKASLSRLAIDTVSALPDLEEMPQEEITAAIEAEYNTLLAATDMSEDRFIAEIAAKDTPADAVNPRTITVAELPASRLFRNAWDDSNPEDFVGVNLAKAQEIAHDKRRANRDELMAPLDKEAGFMSTTPARRTAIDDEKQAILDANAGVQTAIDAAADAAELETILGAASMI